jgi:hypothetical protein
MHTKNRLLLSLRLLLVSVLFISVSLPQSALAAPTWSSGASLNTDRYGHTATRLQDGNVLVAGGADSGGSGNLNSAEVYDPGQGFEEEWRPTVSPISSPLIPGNALSLTGSGFRGYQLSEASGGGTNNSATNYPLVQIRRLDEQCLWISPSAFTGTTFTSLPVMDIPAGPAILTVFVNGIPSESTALVIKEKVYLFMPIISK